MVKNVADTIEYRTYGIISKVVDDECSKVVWQPPAGLSTKKLMRFKDTYNDQLEKRFQTKALRTENMRIYTTCMFYADLITLFADRWRSHTILRDGFETLQFSISFLFCADVFWHLLCL